MATNYCLKIVFYSEMVDGRCHFLNEEEKGPPCLSYEGTRPKATYRSIYPEADPEMSRKTWFFS